jgi:multiple sugar transport system ATP-binding protein
MKGRFSEAKDKEIVFGIRPEHLFDVPNQIQDEHQAEIKVVVDLIETIGAELHLVTHAGKDRIKASINALAQVAAHDERLLYLDMSRMHIFDKKTGLALGMKTT